MTTLRLKTLSLEALRGASRPFSVSFESGKPITIIYGDNGAGKSTICDALDLVGNAAVGSLDGKGLGAASSKYWHSTTRKPTDIKITLAGTSGKWTAQVAKGKVNVTPEDGRPRVAILRRHEILRLIAAKPGERYEAIRPFINIDGIDESERSLRDLINAVERDLSTAEARTGENLQAIENIWKQGGSPGPAMLAWADAEGRRDTAEIDTTNALIKKYIKQQDALSQRTRDWRDAAARVDQARQAVSVADASLAQEIEKATAGDQDLAELLRAARHYFEHQGPPSSCPLCGSREFATGLPETVEAKLQAMASLQAAMNQRNDARKQHDQAVTLAQKAEGAAQTACGEICATCVGTWPKDLPSAKVVLIQCTECAAVPGGTAPDLSKVETLMKAVSELANALDPELTRRTQYRSLLQTLRDALEQYRQNLQQKTALDALLPRLRKAQTVLIEERRAFVDGILKSIATRVGELYEAAHPKEGLSKISLMLDPDKRASLDIASQFPSVKDAVPPAAYLSESHLDTLGVCLFLALAEQHEPAQTILVLDDVVASVDEPHVDRLIEMIYSVSQGFAHCLMTTHYVPWREKFRWGWLKNGQCQFIELGDWSLAEGIVTSKSTPRVDVLRALLAEAAPNSELVCSSAGVILEAVLDFLTRQYECAVPRRRTKPTLGDLLPAVDKKLRVALRVELHDAPPPTGSTAPVVQLGSLLDHLNDQAQLRNILGCHFNELAFQLRGSDGIEFGRTVLAVADVLIHPEHGWPGSDKSGEYWTNSGKSRRLFPLKRPS